MTKRIIFNPVSVLAETTVEKPTPSRLSLPDWYFKMPAFGTKKPAFETSTGKVNHTIKMCLPFSDALEMGYIQKTWQDIMIIANPVGPDLNLEFTYPTQPDILSIREKGNYPIPEEFYQFEMIWHPVWIPELPKGYSVLITHPLNRTDLPFYTLSGVIDSDSYSENPQNANIPVLLKKGFSGLIPLGTPMYQIIPFKRDDWESVTTAFDEKRNLKKSSLIRKHFWGGYKKYHWSKKVFK